MRQENQYIHSQFNQEVSSESTNLTLEADQLEKYFHQLQNDVQQFAEELDKRMNRDISKMVDGVIVGTYQGGEKILVGELLDISVGRNIENYIEKRMEDLPTLDVKDIISANLPDAMAREIKNVIFISNKYKNEKKLDVSPNKDKLLLNKLKKVKKSLAEEGITLKDEIDLKPYDGEEQYFYMQIPDTYRVENLQLTLNGNKISVGDNFHKVKLPAYSDQQKLKVVVQVVLKDIKSDIDIFTPLDWNWGVDQEGMTRTTVNSQTVNPKPDDSKVVDSTPGDSEKIGEEAESNETEAEIDEPVTDPPTDESDPDNSNVEEPPLSEDSSNPEKEIIHTTETNYYSNKHTYEKIIEYPNSTFIKDVYEMIHGYYQLSSIFSMYYGIDMQSKDLSEAIKEEESLADIAKKNADTSLQYTFNQQDLTESLEKFTKNRITEAVTKEINESFAMKELATQLENYHQLLQESQQNSGKLSSMIAETSTEAKKLNENVADLLSELTVWREASDALTAEHVSMMDSEEDMQTAILNLEHEYLPLLHASESLAEQAKLNAGEAEIVYQTFDQINEQADTIQKSGVTLVDQASNLAEQLVAKTQEDVDFSANFNEVLANSRIGDRANEDLYSFLSSPVLTKNEGVIQERETFLPYFLAIILSVLSLFTGYVISTIQQKRMKEEMFEGELPLYRQNLIVTLITAGVGLVEGIIVGLVSSYLLAIHQPFLWITIVGLLMIAMVSITTYLIRQLNMIGMFLLLTIFSLYLFVTRSLGFNFEHGEIIQSIRKASPLQHVETLLGELLDGVKGFHSIGTSIGVIVLVIGIGLLANLFVVRKSSDEGIEELKTETNK